MTRHRRHHRERSSDRDESDSTYSWSHSYGRRHNKRHSRSDTTCHTKRRSRHHDFAESSSESPELWSVQTPLDPYIIRGGRRIRCRCGKRDGLQEDVPQTQCKDGCLLCEKHGRKSSRRSHSCSIRLPDLCVLCPAHAAKEIKRGQEYLMIQPSPELASYGHSTCPIAVPANTICARTHLPGPICVADNRGMCLTGPKCMCHCAHPPEPKMKNEVLPEECHRRCMGDLKAIKAPDVSRQQKHSPEEHAGKSECESTASQSLTTTAQCAMNNNHPKEIMFFEQSGGKCEFSRPDVCCWKQQTGQQDMESFARERYAKEASSHPAQQPNKHAKPSDDKEDGHNEARKALSDQRSFDPHQNSKCSREPACQLRGREATGPMMMSQPLSNWIANKCDSEVSSRFMYSYQQQFLGSPQQWWQHPTNTHVCNRNTPAAGNAQGYNNLPQPDSHLAAEHEFGNETQPRSNCFWERENIQNPTRTGNEAEMVSSVHPYPGSAYLQWPQILRRNSNELEKQQQEQYEYSNANTSLADVFAKAVPLKNRNQNTQADRNRSTAMSNRRIPKLKDGSPGRRQAFGWNKTIVGAQRLFASRRTVFTQTKVPETLANNTTAEKKRSSSLVTPKFMTRGTTMGRCDRLISPRRNWGTQTLSDYQKQRKSKSLDRATISTKSKTSMAGETRRTSKFGKVLSTQMHLSKKSKPKPSRSVENSSDVLLYSGSQELDECDNSNGSTKSSSKKLGIPSNRRFEPSRVNSWITFEKGTQAGPTETKEIAVQAKCPSEHNLCHSRSMEEYASQNPMVLPRALNYQLKSTTSASDVCVSIPSDHTFPAVVSTVPGYGMSLPYVPWPYPMYAPPARAEPNGQEYVIKCKVALDDCGATSSDSKRPEAVISERPERDENSEKTVPLKTEKKKWPPPACLDKRPNYLRMNSFERLQQQQNRSQIQQDRSKRRLGTNAAFSSQQTKDLSDREKSRGWATEKAEHPRRRSVGPERESEHKELAIYPMNQPSNTTFAVKESRSSNLRNEWLLNKHTHQSQQPTKLSVENNCDAEYKGTVGSMKIQHSKFSPTSIQTHTGEGSWKSPITQIQCVQKEDNMKKRGALKSAIGDRRLHPRREGRKHHQPTVQNALRSRAESSDCASNVSQESFI